MMEANLALTHSQYPDGFPARENDDLLGHWKTPFGVVVVEDHPHGYELHFYPCYDFKNCDACSPNRGPRNPHTNDGHHFRLCEARGHILTVAGDKPETVLEYLAREGSPSHEKEWKALLTARHEAELERLEAERLEFEQALVEAKANAPTIEERLAALLAETEELKKEMHNLGVEGPTGSQGPKAA